MAAGVRKLERETARELKQLEERLSHLEVRSQWHSMHCMHADDATDSSTVCPATAADLCHAPGSLSHVLHTQRASQEHRARLAMPPQDANLQVRVERMRRAV